MVITPTHVVVAAGHVIGLLVMGAFRSVATDARGTVVATANGQPIDVSPFGARVAHESLAWALEYAQHGYDADLASVRFGVRDYDPHLGRFRTPDPLFARLTTIGENGLPLASQVRLSNGRTAELRFEFLTDEVGERVIDQKIVRNAGLADTVGANAEDQRGINGEVEAHIGRSAGEGGGFEVGVRGKVAADARQVRGASAERETTGETETEVTLPSRVRTDGAQLMVVISDRRQSSIVRVPIGNATVTDMRAGQ